MGWIELRGPGIELSRCRTVRAQQTWDSWSSVDIGQLELSRHKTQSSGVIEQLELSKHRTVRAQQT